MFCEFSNSVWGRRNGGVLKEIYDTRVYLL